MQPTRRELLRYSALVGLGSVAGMAHARGDTAPPTAGAVRWIHLQNGYKVWTQRLGRGPTKVLLLHGGPGMSHDYMDCFADFLPQAGYEMYFYDQLGCGLSDRPHDARLWTLERYVREVEEVRARLGLDHCILIGHSWGAILAMEYALHFQQHLGALVLSNMTDSAADYDCYIQTLKNTLPAPVVRRLTQLEARGKEASEEYGTLVSRYFFSRYAGRLHDTPAGLAHSIAVTNPGITDRLIGSYQFKFEGELAHWDRRAALPRIHVPTLTIGARYDFMDPRTIEQEAKLIPGAECFISQTGSHMAMYDDQARYFGALLTFLAKHRA